MATRRFRRNATQAGQASMCPRISSQLRGSTLPSKYSERFENSSRHSVGRCPPLVRRPLESARLAGRSHRRHGRRAFAGQKSSFRKKVSVNDVLRVRGWVVRAQKRKIVAEGTLTSADGEGARLGDVPCTARIPRMNHVPPRSTPVQERLQLHFDLVQIRLPMKLGANQSPEHRLSSTPWLAGAISGWRVSRWNRWLQGLPGRLQMLSYS